MPDYSQFIKSLNAHLPAPTSQGAAQGVVVGGKGSSGSAEAANHGETTPVVRTWEAAWRTLTTSDVATKENGARAGGGSAAVAAVHISSHPTVTVGRMMVSTEDRWRIQAQMRREEARTGQTRKEYNKKVTRAIKVTKGPSDNAFPPGRGRPL